MNNAPTLYICRGLPASGKSTWAKKQVDWSNGMYKRVNRDELRAMLDNGTYSPDSEFGIVRVRDVMIVQLLLLNYSVIVDDTNIAPHTVNQLLTIAKTMGVRAQGVVFACPVKVCIERDSKREKPVGATAILQMASQLDSYINTSMDPFNVLKGVHYPSQEGLNVADIRTPPFHPST